MLASRTMDDGEVVNEQSARLSVPDECPSLSLPRCTVRSLSGGAAWPWQVRGGGRRQVRRRNPAVCSRWRLPTSRRRETITRPALCLANPRKSSRILRRPPAQCTTPTKFRPSVRLLHVHATSWGRVAQLHPLHPLHTTVRPPVERSSGQRAAGKADSSLMDIHGGVDMAP